VWVPYCIKQKHLLLPPQSLDNGDNGNGGNGGKIMFRAVRAQMFNSANGLLKTDAARGGVGGANPDYGAGGGGGGGGQGGCPSKRRWDGCSTNNCYTCGQDSDYYKARYGPWGASGANGTARRAKPTGSSGASGSVETTGKQ